jgi:hypothetical protein
MNAKFFAALVGAGVLMAAPVQAKFIGIAIYDPKVMLPICKTEIAQGHAGVCTGYVRPKGEVAGYSMTSSASASIVGGMSRPRALAVASGI